MNKQITTTTKTTKTNKPSKVGKQKAMVPKPYKPNQTRAMSLIQKLQVHDCSIMYANVLVDPFGTPDGACIPSELFPLPSQKSSTLLRGTFSLGTTGYGFLLFNPTLANDLACVMASTGTSVGTSSTAFSAFTNPALFTMTGLPYSNAQFGNGIQGRIVGYGLRIRYVGALMNTNGTIFMKEDPDHNDLKPFSYDTLAADQYSEEVNVTNIDNWNADFNYSGPFNPSDVQFTITPNCLCPLGNYFNGFAIAGIAGDKYTFEIVLHYELIGSPVTGRTPSHSDPEITGKTIEAAKGFTTHNPLRSKDKPSFFQSLFTKIRDTMPMIMAGGKAALSVVTGDFSGAISQGLKMLGDTNSLTLSGDRFNAQIPRHKALGYR